MQVSAPTPDDGNMERLIGIYKNIGFNQGDKKPGNPINLNNTVENLINKLTGQCDIEISGGRKRRKKSRKSKKRRKSRKKSKSRKSRKKSKRRKSRKKRKY